MIFLRIDVPFTLTSLPWLAVEKLSEPDDATTTLHQRSSVRAAWSDRVSLAVEL